MSQLLAFTLSRTSPLHTHGIYTTEQFIVEIMFALVERLQRPQEEWSGSHFSLIPFWSYQSHNQLDQILKQTFPPAVL